MLPCGVIINLAWNPLEWNVKVKSGNGECRISQGNQHTLYCEHEFTNLHFFQIKYFTVFERILMQN